ncbi:hypothetical protein SPRG_04264 [Saprolegnia parasitica CBS 223.65]|uniref:WW domain-containing protein n=1 Tax=Saprolegnia parasitica (strain CBS 223.65) TaxID=695850 RepID=A0A067CPF8_SAPPC|nr:hypothetical protein SPRG_04264 [Saprolegnia parasitica CBS 223.65]KDO31125.1 hypothetical protein SPRG_04264 [Saprolegnia parasitica CBS 223.65]|eukprot:XP_012198254.1 hypothetical protein SPRG_04264 [Saprolegnia parasitica CBS 223.65]
MESTLHARTQRVLDAAHAAYAYVASTRLYHALVLLVLRLTPACHVIFAVLTGTDVASPEAQRERALAKDQLQHNDVYRDRLLALEIDQLVDVGDALRMTSRQRNRFFMTFLKLDWTRRSAITVKDLFLYCGLRRSRLADVVLPPPPRKQSFRQLPNRFEISPLLCALYSFCSLPPAELLAYIVATAETDAVVLDILSQDVEYLQLVQVADAAIARNDSYGPGLRLQAQLARLLQLVIGTLNPHETKLMTALRSLYSTTDASAIDFAAVHGIHHICDFIQRFPAIVYPAFWVQRTLRRRILGQHFWRRMVNHRRVWITSGHTQTFFSMSEILELGAPAPLQPKPEIHKRHLPKPLAKVLPSSWLLATREASYQPAKDEVPPPPLAEVPLVQDTDDVTSTPRSNAPRTCLPDDERLHYEIATAIEGYANAADAWLVTAHNLMAAIHLKQMELDGQVLLGPDAFAAEYTRLVTGLSTHSLPEVDKIAVRKSVVKQYGYQFADFIAGFGPSDTATKDVTAKGAKVKGGKTKPATPVETSYAWDKLYDPAEKRHFYHNVHTGESAWELPRGATLAPSSKHERKKKR